MQRRLRVHRRRQRQPVRWGRNGIFYDRKGLDWDATITKIVDNPISIGQAFWSPYKKLLRWIEEFGREARRRARTPTRRSS
jgi:hypothetical protein